MTQLKQFGKKCLLTLCATAPLVVILGCAPDGKKKVKIESLNELPRRSYMINSSVSELLQDEQRFEAFAGKVRVDVLDDLSTYEIDDATTLKDKLSTLLTIDMYDGRYAEALKRIEAIRKLETKEAAREISGLVTKAMIAAAQGGRIDVHDSSYQAAFRTYLSAAAKQLSWDLIQDEIKQAKGRAEIITTKLMLGIVQARMDPQVTESGEVSSDLAVSIVGVHFAINMRSPLNDIIAEVYQELIDAHRVVKPDIWPEREVVLQKSLNLDPVMIAIWDSGVDVSVFADQLFVNPNETVDGLDTDANGFVDDVHGIAYDSRAFKETELLLMPAEMIDRIEEILSHIKGFADLDAAIDSSAATTLKKHMGSLDPEDVQAFMEGLNFGGQYAHGTHVAGIAMRGNPFAKILTVRIAFDYHIPPHALTMDIGKRNVEAYHETVDYFKKHGVRVVNMSWGWTLKEIETSLEANNIGKDAEERGRMASEVLGVLSDGLRDAMAGAPDILFVTSAGNQDDDVEFSRSIPSSFELPNLLIVGAVDQAGEPTAFTSMGRNVVVYANGFEVESYVPGGDRIKMSGTSMSSPNAANLAAKLIALNPALSPEDVIKLIQHGADPVQGDLSFLLINPKRSVELLEN